MASSPRQRRRPPFWRRSRRDSEQRARLPWGWLVLTALLYLSIGTLLAAFPAPYWIWNLALAGVIAQALALAGPQALGRLRWWRANVLVLLAILGALLVVIALGIALGFVGTDSLDEIRFDDTSFEVLKISGLALFVPAIAAIIGAETGDRLLRLLNRLQTSLVLAATSIMGIGLGGVMGLLLSE